MATAESVKSKIQGLIDTANGTTGEAATDLTTAINALIAGFGKGSDDEGGVKVWAGFKTAPSTAYGTRVAIDFGFTPDFIFVMPYGSITLTSGKAYLIAFCGFTTAVKNALGTSGSYRVTTSGTNKTDSISSGWTIDGSDAGINRVDATGFNLGSLLYSTSLFVLALGGLI